MLRTCGRRKRTMNSQLKPHSKVLESAQLFPKEPARTSQGSIAAYKETPTLSSAIYIRSAVFSTIVASSYFSVASDVPLHSQQAWRVGSAS